MTDDVFSLPTQETLLDAAQDYGTDLAEHHIRRRGYGDVLDMYHAAQDAGYVDSSYLVPPSSDGSINGKQTLKEEARFPFTDDAY